MLPCVCQSNSSFVKTQAFFLCQAFAPDCLPYHFQEHQSLKQDGSSPGCQKCLHCLNFSLNFYKNFCYINLKMCESVGVWQGQSTMKPETRNQRGKIGCRSFECCTLTQIFQLSNFHYCLMPINISTIH